MNFRADEFRIDRKPLDHFSCNFSQSYASNSSRAPPYISFESRCGKSSSSSFQSPKSSAVVQSPDLFFRSRASSSLDSLLLTLQNSNSRLRLQFTCTYCSRRLGLNCTSKLFASIITDTFFLAVYIHVPPAHDTENEVFS